MRVQRGRWCVRASFSGLACSVAAVGAIALGPVASARTDLFGEIFKQGQAKNGAMKTLTASFVETTTSTLLTRPLVSSGTLAVVRPSRIVLRYTQPDQRVVLIDGDTMTLSWPSRHLHESRDIAESQKRIHKYFVDSSPGELRSHFTIDARLTEDRPGTYLVTMVPKRKQILEGLSRLELWVDRTTQLMVAMKMSFPNGDSKLMTFSDVKPNAPIDPSVFSVDGR
jgi:outer membrane lipoprotein-sorting protein